jgi:hypothetical protein
MRYDNSYTVEGQKFEVIETIVDDAYADDYGFHEGVIFRGEDGSLYWFEDSGCSCYSFGENLDTLSDLTPVKNWQEAVELAKDSFKDDDVFEFADRLRNG